MPPNLNYSQLLRPVGQMLEPLQIESFALKVEDGGVAVYAEKRETQPAPDVSLKVSWQIFRRKKTAPAQAAQPSSGTLEIHYTLDDIARMDSAGQQKRSGAEGTPEAHALSQILRAVGAFVDQKQGRLLSVSMDGQEIGVEYSSAAGSNHAQKFTVASLYDFWVRMYLRRRQR